MSVSSQTPLEDTQAQADARGVVVSKVGVSSLRWSGRVHDGQSWQPAILDWRLGVELPADQRGTHMSRFVQWVRDEACDLDPLALAPLAESLRERLGAPSAHLEVATELFRELEAPLSREAGQVSSRLQFKVVSREDEATTRGRLVQPIATLCPCSKAISSRGAHNQRGEMRLSWLGCALPLPFVEMCALVDECASAPLYPVLKRGDEKWVTEHAYDHPAFVEDVVREAALKLRRLELPWFRVEVENFESIHQHNAWAVVEEGEPAR